MGCNLRCDMGRGLWLQWFGWGGVVGPTFLAMAEIHLPETPSPQHGNGTQLPNPATEAAGRSGSPVWRPSPKVVSGLTSHPSSPVWRPHSKARRSHRFDCGVGHLRGVQLLPGDGHRRQTGPQLLRLDVPTEPQGLRRGARAGQGRARARLSSTAAVSARTPRGRHALPDAPLDAPLTRP